MHFVTTITHHFSLFHQHQRLLGNTTPPSNASLLPTHPSAHNLPTSPNPHLVSHPSTHRARSRTHVTTTFVLHLTLTHLSTHTDAYSHPSHPTKPFKLFYPPNSIFPALSKAHSTTRHATTTSAYPPPRRGQTKLGTNLTAAQAAKCVA